jgi:hypothetical protein
MGPVDRHFLKKPTSERGGRGFREKKVAPAK